MNTFKINLTKPEYELFKTAFTTSSAVGDCVLSLRRNQISVTFEDYEGVMGTIGRLLEVPTPVDPQFSVWWGLRKKINEGVDKATPRSVERV